MRLLLMVIAITFSINAFAQDARNCLKQWQGGNSLQGKWGEHCGSKDSVTYEITNICNQPIYFKGCLEKTNGEWSCGSHTDLEPGVTDYGFWVCNGTGRMQWAACTGGYKECGFKNP